MGYTVQIAKKALIRVGTGGGDALETLGYTRNGADVTKEAFFLDVPGDEYGGDDGPPIEMQFLGEIARVRLEFTKWDKVIAAKLTARLKGKTAGTIDTDDIGALVFTNEYYMRLLILAVDNPRNFPWAVMRMPIEINRGTKFSTLVIEAECHRNQDDGILYDNVIV